jgi:hypothetical protein
MDKFISKVLIKVYDNVIMPKWLNLAIYKNVETLVKSVSLKLALKNTLSHFPYMSSIKLT